MDTYVIPERSTERKIIPYPTRTVRPEKSKMPPTPVTDKLEAECVRLNLLSDYRSQFDFTPFRKLEMRFSKDQIRGGIVKHSPMKLVNSHHTCQQCLYALELDTYGRGCSHNCVYCYAKAELTVHGYWNNPIPVPVDINEIRKMFYVAFETDRRSKWRSIFERRIPIRIGCMSDSFMWMDDKYKVTQELLKILSFYQYPYTALTRSDLIARDDYLELLDPKLAHIQMSIASMNDDMNRLLEPGTPSAKRRLGALSVLTRHGYLTAVRINPIFPIYPDGYFTDSKFSWNGPVPKFDFSTFEMVEDIAEAGVPSVIAGFGRFSSFALNNVKKVSGVDLKPFFNKAIVNKSKRDFHFSDEEIRYYYLEYKKRCSEKNIEFTTCYIGNGESHFWDHQDLWSNKKDCCNIKDHVPSFKTDCREIKFEERLKFTNHKCSKPVSDRLYEELGKANMDKSNWVPTFRDGRVPPPEATI